MSLGSDLRFRRGIPRAAIAPAADQEEAADPLLVLGELPRDVERYARDQGIEIIRVLTPSRAIDHLASRRFRAVAVSPEIEGGIQLVKQLKLGSDAGDDGVRDAASKNGLTPVVILPFAGDTEYAVILIAREVAYLERTSSLRLSDALLHLDAARLGSFLN